MNMRELLNAWMNGSTLQYRSRNPVLARSQGWRDIHPFDENATCLSLSPGFDYRIKPKVFTLVLDEQQMETLGRAIADYCDRNGTDDYIESLEKAAERAEASE
jgi:hypothetical protein